MGQLRGLRERRVGVVGRVGVVRDLDVVRVEVAVGVAAERVAAVGVDLGAVEQGVVIAVVVERVGEGGVDLAPVGEPVVVGVGVVRVQVGVGLELLEVGQPVVVGVVVGTLGEVAGPEPALLPDVGQPVAVGVVDGEDLVGAGGVAGGDLDPREFPLPDAELVHCAAHAGVVPTGRADSLEVRRDVGEVVGVDIDQFLLAVDPRVQVAVRRDGDHQMVLLVGRHLFAEEPGAVAVDAGLLAVAAGVGVGELLAGAVGAELEELAPGAGVVVGVPGLDGDAGGAEVAADVHRVGEAHPVASRARPRRR